MKKQKNSLLRNDGFQSLLASLACVVGGLLVGYLVLLFIEPSGASKAILAVMKSFFNYKGKLMLKYFGQNLVRTVPLVMCSLSVLFAYKVGMFNIGVAGQYVAGACASLYAALAWNLPWYLCLVVAMLAGGLLAAISGFLKTKCNVNVVISGIMLNWITLYLTNFILGKVKSPNSPYTLNLRGNNASALIPGMGLEKLFNGEKSMSIAIPITIVVAVLIWILLSKTKIGYELKATGHNYHAARYAGMKENWNIVIAMLISGALAGMGAGMFYLTGIEEWETTISSVPVKNTPEEKQGFALGMLTTAYWCGIMLGSVVGGLVVSYYGYKNTFWFCGILYFLAGVAVLFARDDYIPGRNKTGDPAEKRSFREFMRTVFPAFTIAVRLLMLLTFLSGVVCSFSPAYIPMLIERITGIKEAAFWTGITSAVAAAGSILSGVVIGSFADRAKPLRLLIPIFIITGLCLYIQAVSPGLFADPETQWVICGKTFSVNLDLLVLGISRFLQLLVLGGSGAIFMKMLSNSTPKRKRGAVFGYRSTAYQIGGMLASFCGGGLMFLCNDARSVFYVGALLFLLLIPMTVWIVRRVESQPFYKDHASLAEK